MNGDPIDRRTALRVVGWKQNVGKAESCRLSDSLLNVRHTAALARKSYLTDSDERVGYLLVGQRGDERHCYAKVGCGLVYLKTADDVEVNVAAREFKSETLLEDCEGKAGAVVIYAV